jgi:integrase
MSTIPAQPRKPKTRADGEGSIFQRASDGLWIATSRYQGKTIRFTAKRRQDAIDKRNQWLQNRSAGLKTNAREWLLDDWLSYWLNDHKRPRYDRAGNRIGGIEPTTFERYESALRLHVRPFLGRVRLVKLTAEMVERWQRELNDRGRGADLQHAALALLSAALGLAHKRGYVPANVAAAGLVDRPRLPTRRHVQPSETDLAALLRVVRGDPFEALVWLGMGGGFRRAEVAALDWQNVTYHGANAAVIHAHRRVNRVTRRTRQALHLDSPRLEREGLKSQNERFVHVGGAVVEVLQRRWRQQLADRLEAGPAWQGPDYQANTPTGYIFTMKNGVPISVDKFTRYFASVRQRAGLDIDRFHALRRVFTTLMIEAGVADRVTMDQAGHKRLEMTHYYQQPMETQKRAAAQALDAVLRRLAESAP